MLLMVEKGSLLINMQKLITNILKIMIKMNNRHILNIET